MRGLEIRRAAVVLLVTVSMGPGCQKETRSAAMRAYRDITARPLSPDDRARALADFVAEYPQPKTNPDLLRALQWLATHEDAAGRFDAAAAWYERTVTVAPEDPDVLNAAGYYDAVHGLRLDRAVEMLTTADRLASERKLNPRHRGLIKDSLGWALVVRGDRERGASILEEASALAPDVKVIRDHLDAARSGRVGGAAGATGSSGGSEETDG